MRSFFRGGLLALSVALIGLFAMTRSADAAGFGIAEQSVRASGMNNAYSSLVDDPSAIYYNPGALGFLKGLQSSTGITIIRVRSRYDGYSGNDTDLRDRNAPVPYFYSSAEINDMFNVGIGVYAPYGTALSWPTQGETRYNNIRAQLRAQYITPTIAFRPTDWISIGIGISYVTTRRLLPHTGGKEGVRVHRAVDLVEPTFAGLRAQLPASVPDSAVRQQARAIASSVPEPMSRLKGNVDGWGYSFGVMAKPFDQLSLGLTYRGEVYLNGNGVSEFQGVQDPTGLPPGTFTNTLVRSHIRTSLVLPPSLAIAATVKPFNKLSVTAQADWTGWSTVDEIRIRFTNGKPRTVQVLDLGWTDVWAYRVGVEYLVIGTYEDMKANAEKRTKGSGDDETEGDEEESSAGGMVVAVRAGYLYDTSPIPNETVSAFLPDNDRNAYSVGVGFDMGFMAVDASVQYFHARTIRRDAFSEGVDNEFHPNQGVFRTDAWLFGLGATLRF